MESYLGQEVAVMVDHPLGTTDEREQFIYSLNYGYVYDENQKTQKKMGTYILGEHNPLSTYLGQVIAIVKGNNEEQLVVAEKPAQYSREQILALIEFKESNKDSEVMVPIDILTDGETIEEARRASNVAFVIAFIQIVVLIFRGERADGLFMILTCPWIVSSYYALKRNSGILDIAQFVGSIVMFTYWTAFYIVSLI